MEIISDDEIALSLASQEITVKQILRKHLLECPPTMPLFEVAKLMSEARCSAVIISDGKEPLGIWTERDALTIDFSSSDALNQPVERLMSRPLKNITGETTLQEVASRFLEEGVRHFLVVDDEGGTLGVVSQTDVVLNQGIEHYLRLRKVDSVMKDNQLVFGEEVGLGEVARQMSQVHTDAALIRYGTGEYGIITGRDIVQLIARRLTDCRVGGLATRPLITIATDASLYRARNVLVQNGIRHIGVVDGQGDVRGLISLTEILFGVENVYVQELRQALAERDQALQHSQRSLHLAEKVIESSLEGIVVTDAQGLILSVNPSFTRLTGYRAQEVIGKTPAVLRSGRHDKAFYSEMWRRIREEGNWQGEVWNRRKNGEVYPQLLTIAAIRDEAGELSHYAALFSDISELKDTEARIRNLAYYDPLTHLPNRRLLQDRLSVAIAHAHRSQGRLAVVFIDLDRFKRINDSLGHAIGDQLLQEVASRLQCSVKEDDTVARMGGDEFVILLSDIEDIEQVVQVARRTLEAMSLPILVNEQELVITCSLGISIYPEDGVSLDSLIQNADSAMYRAKEAGRNSYQLYSATMNAHSLEHLALEVTLRKAIQEEELSVHFQPLFDARNETLVSAEALLRWHSPTMGWVSPSDFIPLAEESGLIVQIGEFVLRRVCRELQRWTALGYEAVSVAVNVSAMQFRSKDFLESTRAVIQEYDIRPGQLTFELTESMLVDEAVENIRTMNALRKMGICLAVDDFGTGYSSLSYLRRFPVDTLKIDRAFIRDIDTNQQGASLVAAVILLGHSLGLKVVGEGVEREGQLRMLQGHGCDLIQGFHYSAAVDGVTFEQRYLPTQAVGE